MKKILVAILLILGTAGIKPLFVNAGDAPTYKDGDSWVYRLTIIQMSEQKSSFTDDDYKVTYKKGALESDSDTFLERVATIYMHDSEIKWFDFPLNAGKKWSFSYILDRYNWKGRVRSFNVESNV